MPNMPEVQANSAVEWLEEQRMKDRKLLAAMHEQLAALETAQRQLLARVAEFEADLQKARAAAVQSTKVPDLLDQLRGEIGQLLDGVEQRRSKAEREAEKHRLQDRDLVNGQLADLLKRVEALRVVDELAARKEGEMRLFQMAGDMRQRLDVVVRGDGERTAALASIQEQRRQDAKRMTDMYSELQQARRRVDELKARADVMQDVAVRSDARVGEMLGMETERHTKQAAWLEQQNLVQLERERGAREVQAALTASETLLREFSQRMDIYAESHREMQRTAQSFGDQTARLDRAVVEAREAQRLLTDRMLEEWNEFAAADQRKWNAHLLSRDEQWREHLNRHSVELARLAVVEQGARDAADLLRAFQKTDQTRLKALLEIIHEALSAYEQPQTRVR
ncbi:MAG: hypothetical protein DWI61_02215 [Chloroflexi bacterium]|nr:MAG: hypothetical protein DWI61_02215 [Chloroflexota bacterium]